MRNFWGFIILGTRINQVMLLFWFISGRSVVFPLLLFFTPSLWYVKYLAMLEGRQSVKFFLFYKSYFWYNFD